MQQDQEPDSPDARHVPTAGAAVLLSIGEAAAKLGTSPAYVTMLLDKGRLGGVVETSEGQRRVHALEVDAFLAQQRAAQNGVKDFREVAQDIGMYDIPEERYARCRTMTVEKPRV